MSEAPITVAQLHEILRVYEERRPRLVVARDRYAECRRVVEEHFPGLKVVIDEHVPPGSVYLLQPDKLPSLDEFEIKMPMSQWAALQP